MIEFFTQSLFAEIAALLVLATFIGWLGLYLRQPLIVSFIIVGLIVGESGFQLLKTNEHISLLSELGVSVLLFLVGIRLDLKLIKSLGGVALLVGLNQLFFTTVIGFFVSYLLGFSLVNSLFIGFCLTLSSTIIVVKLLTDKREIEALHGQIAVGILIVQDVAVIAVMIALSAIGLGSTAQTSDTNLWRMIGLTLAFLVAIGLFMRFGAQWLTDRLSKAPDLLNCFALALAALFAVIADHIGLGKELGGLLAGLTLASTPYRDTIAARLGPLRDFLLLFFFVALGAQVNLFNLDANLWQTAILVLFVLVGNPLIMWLIMSLMGFPKRTSFLCGIMIAQVSEFSLILLSLGKSLGHASVASVEMVTMVALISIGASTYLITFANRLFLLFDKYIRWFEFSNSILVRNQLQLGDTKRHYDVIIFGTGRLGTAIALRLQARRISVLGVDFSPTSLKAWTELGFDAEYGDGIDPEFLETIPLHTANWVISTVPVPFAGIAHSDPRLAMLQSLKKSGFKGRIAITSYFSDDSWQLIKSGADLALEPFQDAADRAVELITGVSNIENY